MTPSFKLNGLGAVRLVILSYFCATETPDEDNILSLQLPPPRPKRSSSTEFCVVLKCSNACVSIIIWCLGCYL